MAAIYNYGSKAAPVNRDELIRIRDSMRNRGPDGSGAWYSEYGDIGVAHRRLSIIDLSDRASQPMCSEDGQIVISFNGEIYNYRELRKELEHKGYRFRSTSDTEVLLNLYCDRGMHLLDKIRGMFAFVLWDQNKNSCYLIRDPYGIKPLYYSNNGNTLRVASQVKGLIAGNRISKNISAAGSVSFMLMGSVIEPFTIYEDILSVPAGSFIVASSKGVSEPHQYFSLPSLFQNAEARVETNQDNFQAQIRQALRGSLHDHTVSDVPVGIFLSSGIDSSALLGVANDCGYERLDAITLGFKEYKGTAEDEVPLARIVAEKYKSKHNINYLTKNEFLSDLPTFFDAMDQPTIDGVNTWFVSKAAANAGLKVVLSGLGGDELFGGYPSFRSIPLCVSTVKTISRIPSLGSLSQKLCSGLRNHFQRINPKYCGLLKYGGTYPGAYFLRRGIFMPWELNQFFSSDVIEQGVKELRLLSRFQELMPNKPSSDYARVMSMESGAYLRNQLLRDTDWTSMAHSIEVRPPILDLRLQKITANMIDRNKIKRGKRVLGTCTNSPLPSAILGRPKTGFTVPIKSWIQDNPDFQSWKKIEFLNSPNTHWSRRWAYSVADTWGIINADC